MMELVKYDKARQALEEAKNFDEVKDIRDKAEAMKAYAKQANDKEMVMWASEIKVRAERKLGAMLIESAENGTRATQGTHTGNQHTIGNVVKHDISNTSPAQPPSPTPKPVTLPEIGITRDQSSRFQKIAAMPKERFETAVTMAKEVASQVSASLILKAAEPPKPTYRERNTVDANYPLPEIKVHVMSDAMSDAQKGRHVVSLIEDLAKMDPAVVLAHIPSYNMYRVEKSITPAYNFIQHIYQEVTNG